MSYDPTTTAMQTIFTVVWENGIIQPYLCFNGFLIHGVYLLDFSICFSLLQKAESFDILFCDEQLFLWLAEFLRDDLSFDRETRTINPGLLLPFHEKMRERFDRAITESPSFHTLKLFSTWFLDYFEPSSRPNVDYLDMSVHDARNLGGLVRPDAAGLLRGFESHIPTLPADMPGVARTHAFWPSADNNVMLGGSPPYRSGSNGPSQDNPYLPGGNIIADLTSNFASLLGSAGPSNSTFQDTEGLPQFWSAAELIESSTRAIRAGCMRAPPPLDLGSPSDQTSPSAGVYSPHNSENEDYSLANTSGTVDAIDTEDDTGGSSSLVNQTLQLTMSSPFDTGHFARRHAGRRRRAGLNDFITMKPDGTIVCLVGECRHLPDRPTGQQAKGRRCAHRGQFEASDPRNQGINVVKHLKDKHGWSDFMLEYWGAEIRRAIAARWPRDGRAMRREMRRRAKNGRLTNRWLIGH